MKCKEHYLIMQEWSRVSNNTIEDIVHQYSTLINTYVQEDLKKQEEGLLKTVDQFDIKGLYGDQAIKKLREQYEKGE